MIAAPPKRTAPGGHRLTEIPPIGAFTCPAIDAARQAVSRLAWRVKNKPETPEDHINLLLTKALNALEVVRAENSAMRRAYTEAVRSR